jgi:hypothetical protein
MLREINENYYFQENSQHYFVLATMFVTLMILVMILV